MAKKPYRRHALLLKGPKVRGWYDEVSLGSEATAKNYLRMLGWGRALLVCDIPTEQLQEGIDEFPAKLGLLVGGIPIGVSIPLEPLNQFL
jgi:hypothetical protein